MRSLIILITILAAFAVTVGCAAKDPNKVTPSKTIGGTTCADSSGDRVTCPEKKTQ
jgi:hypothetical protein